MPLGEYAAMHLTTDSRDQMYVATLIDEAMGVAAQALRDGRSIKLEGIGVIEVVEMPSRRVRANFQGSDAQVYETGPRLHVRLRLDERLQRKMTAEYQQRLALMQEQQP
ncbi:MAG: HU family DNA-binding protein [bacterium]